MIVKSDSDVIKFLKNHYKNEEQKPVIICCSDSSSSIVDLNRNILIDNYYLPGKAEQGSLTQMMSKRRMTELAEEVGLMTPYSLYYSKDGSLDFSLVRYPCITKPLLSKDGSKSDIAILNDNSILKTYLNEHKNSNVQIQEFIDKDFEYQLIGCSTKKEVVIPGVSIIQRPCKGSNTSFLHYIPLEKGFCDIEKCYDFVKKTGYHGLFSLEFLRDKKGNDYFMEINFRNDGNGICVTASGVNLPYIWYLDCIGRNYSSELTNVVNPIYVMPDMAELKLLLTRQISIKEYISDFRKTDRFMEYDKNDPKPFWKLLRMKLLRF